MNVVDDTVVRMVIPSSDLQFLLGHIERCEVLKDDGTNAEVVVYWGVPEMQRLVRVYGDAPNPMLKEYDWPGMFQPFAHQKVTASFLSLRDRCFCFNEAGTGKTSSARNYAALNKLPFVTIECTQQIDQSVTQGRFVPTGVGNSTQWKYSQLASAIQRPSVVLLNELTRMSPKAASLFLRLLAERELLIEPLNEVIKVHPECLIIADQNTGLGYTGTSKQDTALIDRFSIKLEFKYDTSIESKFIKSPALLEFASNIREASELNDEFSTPMSTRVLQNFQAQATSLNFAFAVHALLNNYPKSDGERDAIKMRLDAEIDRIASDLGVELGTYNG
jgi:hypothetical protein